MVHGTRVAHRHLERAQCSASVEIAADPQRTLSQHNGGSRGVRVAQSQKDAANCAVFGLKHILAVHPRWRETEFSSVAGQQSLRRILI